MLAHYSTDSANDTARAHGHAHSGLPQYGRAAATMHQWDCSAEAWRERIDAPLTARSRRVRQRATMRLPAIEMTASRKASKDGSLRCSIDVHLYGPCPWLL